jgi:hypothetical protein
MDTIEEWKRGIPMNLNKIGFWAVTATTFLVSLILGIDYMFSQGHLPTSMKCNIIIWSIIFVAILITVKLLSMFERMDNQVKLLKEDLENARWQLSTLQFDNASLDSLEMSSYGQRMAVGNNVIPFPMRSMNR